MNQNKYTKTKNVKVNKILPKCFLSNNFIGIQFIYRNMNRPLLFRGIQTLHQRISSFLG
jgi:hypothetical protein